MKCKRKLLSAVLAGVLSMGLLAGCAQTGGTPNDTVSDPVSSEAAPSSDVSEQVSSAAESAPAQPERPDKDREGNDITLPDTIERIISTAPSNTEVLVALGLSDKLVAVDKYSADVEGISPEIPQLDFRNPDGEAIISLEPDVIIASGHNREGDEDPFALIKQAGICVVYIPSSYSIQGILDDIDFLGRLTDTSDRAQELIADYSGQVEKIKAIAATIPEGERKKVYFEIGPAPNLYSFGKDTFLNEFISTAGAVNIFAEEESWISPSAESVLEANPDVILTNVSYVEDAVGEIKSREGWDALTAVQNNAVYLIPGNSSSRPSHLSIEALKEIARAVYPDYYA